MLIETCFCLRQYGIQSVVFQEPCLIFEKSQKKVINYTYVNHETKFCTKFSLNMEIFLFFTFLINVSKILRIKNQCDLYDLFVLLIYLYNTYSQKKDRWLIFKETIRRVHTWRSAPACNPLF